MPGIIATNRRSNATSRLLGAGAILCFLSLAPESAYAIPSFALQTNQPCSSCHIGAFGPRLKQAGRDFKLYGYTASDMQPHPLPISAIVKFSYTHTSKDELGAALQGYAKNDNVALDEIDGYYGGRITANAGALFEISYDPVQKTLGWGDLDVRYARDFTVQGSDLVVGATLNNAPTEADIWEAEPQWAFPFVASQLANVPEADPLVDLMVGTSIGTGIYADWNSTLYAEIEVYNGLGRNALNSSATVGSTAPISSPDRHPIGESLSNTSLRTACTTSNWVRTGYRRMSTRIW